MTSYDEALRKILLAQIEENIKQLSRTCDSDSERELMINKILEQIEECFYISIPKINL